jgi:heme A synthase
MLLTGSAVVGSNADIGCHTWPLCGGGLTPDFSGANAFTMLHRGAVLLIGALLVYVMINALRRPRLGIAASTTLFVFFVQVAVGAGAAVTGAALFNGLHVAIATLVWAGVVTTAVLTLPRADRAAELSHLAVERRSA